MSARGLVVIYALDIFLFIFTSMCWLSELGVSDAGVLQRPSTSQLLICHSESVVRLILLHAERRPVLQCLLVC